MVLYNKINLRDLLNFNFNYNLIILLPIVYNYFLIHHLINLIIKVVNLKGS
jgi:hypothetical protein